MNETQAKITARMLEMASDEFSNHGCNDYELPATPENIEFVKGLIAWSDYPEDEPNIHDGMIYLYDWQVMDYCRHLVIESAQSGEDVV